MAYSTVANILTNLPGLPPTNTAEGYSNTVSLITGHIVRADSLIDGKCAKRYSLPFSPVPPMIRTISEDIAGWFTYRSEYSQDNQNVSEYLELLYAEARDWLTEIQEGNIDLVDTSGSIVARLSTTAQSLVDSYAKDFQPFFDEDSATSWKVDADKLTGISNNR